MRRLALLLALVASIASSAVADDVGARFAGRVVGVSDGDTISVLRDGREVRIRLDGIDAPEGGQAYGQRAKVFVSDLVYGRTVTVLVKDIDRYGRLVARVAVDGRDVSLATVEAGYAWHFVKYSNDATLAAAEREARTARRGLWQDPRAVPPWEFRAGRTEAARAAATGQGYRGNVRSRVFHGPTCQHFTCPNCTAVFTTQDEARRAGYRAHSACVS